MRRTFWNIIGVLLFSAMPLQAGMTVYYLSDLAKLRMQDISFFAVLFLLSTTGIRMLWNCLARDFSRLPRLDWRRAFALSTLMGLLVLLVLTMISGAREIFTPDAWRKQGHGYRLNAEAADPVRRQSLESLRVALFDYAKRHDGRFPAYDFDPDIPEKLWQSPDGGGTHYVYPGGKRLDATKRLLACEPGPFGEMRYALFSDGEIRKLTNEQIDEAIQQAEAP